eukprot:gene18880-25438_t
MHDAQQLQSIQHAREVEELRERISSQDAGIQQLQDEMVWLVNFIHEADQETSLNSERIIQLMTENKEKDEKIMNLDLETSLKSESIIKLGDANLKNDKKLIDLETRLMIIDLDDHRS